MFILVSSFRVHYFSLFCPTFHDSKCASRFDTRCGCYTEKVGKRGLVVAPFEQTGRLPVLYSSRVPWRRTSLVDPSEVRRTSALPCPSNFREGVTDTDLEDPDEESLNGVSSLELNGHLLDRSQLAALRSDPIRSRLIRKLSEANQYSRHLLREVQEREKAIMSCKLQMSALELELGILASIAQEIAREPRKQGTRKINGRYIHSHLACRLADLQNTLHDQTKEFDEVQSRDVELSWSGMAEDVTVMGSFDSWCQGESMSPESTGTYTQFCATLKLRPGRYEIKFRVDGDWKLSPDLPTVGEGLVMNNLLIVT